MLAGPAVPAAIWIGYVLLFTTGSDHRRWRDLDPGSPVAATLAWRTSQSDRAVKGRAVEVGTPTQHRLPVVDVHILAVARCGFVLSLDRFRG